MLCDKLGMHCDQYLFSSSSQSLFLLQQHAFKAIPPRSGMPLSCSFLGYGSDTEKLLIQGQSWCIIGLKQVLCVCLLFYSS